MVNAYPHATSLAIRSEQEIAALLARYEQYMAGALEREECASHSPRADREVASDAAFEYLESEATAQVLRWVLGLETDADYSHLFPEPS